MLNAENEINQAKLESSSERPSGPENATQEVQEDASVAESSGAKPNADRGKSSPDNISGLQAVLHSISQVELPLLCSLLAHDGYELLTSANLFSNLYNLFSLLACCGIAIIMHTIVLLSFILFDKFLC